VNILLKNQLNPMTNLPAICLLALLVVNPVPLKWFNAVCENTGVQFDYDNQTHHDTVRELLMETFRGREQ